MKAFYLVYETLDLGNPDGVEKKIIAQREMYRANGIDMEFHILKKKKGTFWNNPEALSGAEFIYFRRGTVTDFRMIEFLQKIKKQNKNVVIFMEIPTFPYENECDKSLRSTVSIRIDRCFRKKLSKFIDRLVIVNHHCEKVWGIPVLNLVNGMDIATVAPRKPRKPDGKIRICCVAKFSPWHGYERLIRGLRKYYMGSPDIDVDLVMVGTGVETELYERLTKDLDLECHVDFRGKLMGNELDFIYDECDIGCCSLGRYKSGIDVTSELKSREFMAKGMPMICGCKIDVLEDAGYPYAIYFPNNETDIDVKKVVEMYKSMVNDTNVESIINIIRQFAEDKVDIKATYQPIVNEAIKLCGELR